MDATPDLTALVITGDGCAVSCLEIHRQAPALYRRNPLYPLFRICNSQQLPADLAA